LLRRTLLRHILYVQALAAKSALARLMTMPEPGHKERVTPMPDEQPIHPLERARQVERDILYLLTDPEDNQPLWTLDDLAREMDQPDITQYIGPLRCAGRRGRLGGDQVLEASSSMCFAGMPSCSHACSRRLSAVNRDTSIASAAAA
jgi:hypothetical protein